MRTDLTPGFAEPVQEAQACFRGVLDAMAHPGRIVRLAPAVEPPQPLSSAAASLALTLLDYETPLWLDPEADRPAVRAWLGFHTGVRRTTATHEAAFALIARPAGMPPLSQFQPGSDAYPDRSATLILEVASLTDGAGLTLRGPGIKGETIVRVAGLPDDFARQWSDNHARFPLGVDVVLSEADRILALPRTTSIEA